jgi:lipoyl(octanoyl) transferase
MDWRFVISGKMDPYMNMAIDETIYKEVSQGNSPPTIRFYDWNPATFSFGYNQNAEVELDLQKVESSGYSYVRRPTGGRLVLHEDEVTYAVISPLKESMSGQITDTYLRIGKALLCGLKKLGIDADLERGILSGAEQRQPVNPCFTSSSRFELTWRKKKIVGSAQTRNTWAFLQHGSILRTVNQKKVAQFLPGISEDNRLRIESFLERRTVSLSKILDRNLSFEEAVKCLMSGFEEEWSEESFFLVDTLRPEEIELAQELSVKKYSGKDWNKNRLDSKKDLTHT